MVFLLLLNLFLLWDLNLLLFILLFKFCFKEFIPTLEESKSNFNYPFDCSFRSMLNFGNVSNLDFKVELSLLSLEYLMAFYTLD